MVKALFFDFDGTLADTAPGIVLTMQKAFEEMHLPVPTDAQVCETIGMPLVEAIALLGHLDSKGAEQGVEVYRKLFPIYEAGHVKVFPQVDETLSALQNKGIRMAICTSRTGLTLDVMVQRFGIDQYFETKVSCNDGLPAKPAPDMVYELLRRMNLSIDEVMVVGDTTFDIEMGNNAGCRTVAVTYGNHSRERLLTANPTYLIDRIEQVLDLLSD